VKFKLTNDNLGVRDIDLALYEYILRHKVNYGEEIKKNFKMKIRLLDIIYKHRKILSSN